MLPQLSGLLSIGLLASGAASAACIRKGFVTVKGTKFQLDGEDFNFAGSNAYYFPFDNVRDASRVHAQLTTFLD